MEKASGVYISINDQSFQTGGAQVLKVIVPMLTKKGKLGMNYVTADTFKDVLGYDELYNSNYIGLKKILENIAYAQVWRLNQGATVHNSYLVSADSASFTSKEDAENEESVTTESHVIAVGFKDPGDWQTPSFKITPTDIVTMVKANANGVTSVAFDTSITETLGNKTILSGCKIYNSTNNTLIAVIEASTYNVYVVNGGSIGAQIGSASVSSGIATFTFTTLPNFDSFWNIRTIPSQISEWTITFAKVTESGTHVAQVSYDFSLNASSDIYWNKIDFGDYFVDLAITADQLKSVYNAITKNYVTMDNGTDGVGIDDILPSKIDTSVMDGLGYNILAMNGITKASIINTIVTRAEANKVHMFVDAPDYGDFISVKEWRDTISSSKYVVICARPDTTELSNGRKACIYPSVTYVLIYAKMMNDYGFLNYPPAGKTTGVGSFEELVKCDFENYADDLKTARINWQRIIDNVGVIWEQRTTYALNTDFSYVAPVFIIDSLAEELASFEANYNFRYTTSSELVVQQSGLKSILDNYIDNNFLYSYDIKMPTYEEVQKGGRTVDIKIEVVVMKDSEVINLGITLTNA